MRRLVPHVRIPGFRLTARLRACAIFYLQPHGAWAQPSHTIVRLGFTMHERVRSGLGARAQDAQLRCMQLMQALELGGMPIALPLSLLRVRLVVLTQQLEAPSFSCGRHLVSLLKRLAQLRVRRLLRFELRGEGGGRGKAAPARGVKDLGPLQQHALEVTKAGARGCMLLAQRLEQRLDLVCQHEEPARRWRLVITLSLAEPVVAARHDRLV